MRAWHRLSLILVLALGASAAATAQDQATEKIPRRVYFAPAVVDTAVEQPEAHKIPDYLYTAISAQQPIVRVDGADQANSIVRVEVKNPGPSVEVTLLESGNVVAKVSFVAANFTDLARYVQKTAADLASHLGFVTPVVKRSTSSQALIQKVELSNRLARPSELSIEGLGLIRFQPNEGPPGSTIGFDPLPLILRYSYFPSRSLGIDGSLLTYYGTRLSFGETFNNTVYPVTRALLLLPGVGVRYRSLGTVFAAFSATLYGGYGYVTNIAGETIGDNRSSQFQPFLAAGASTSIFYMLIRFASEIGYNFSSQFAVRAGVALDLSPTVFFNTQIFGYPAQGNSFFLQYLTLGISYRP